MVAAWRWMAANRPDGHVYLSSDIYRHPTYMYLGERATVLTYFEHANPRLSWFDGRGALPLPDADGATYVIGASAPLGPQASELLAGAEVVHREDALTVLRAAPRREAPALAGQDIGGGLALLRATRLGDGALEMEWRAQGPVGSDWGGYWLEVESAGQVTRLPFDAFRAPEWRAGGRFITWHALDPAAPEVRLRVLRMADGSALGEADGWQTVAVE
jgi:hypothetical protein